MSDEDETIDGGAPSPAGTPIDPTWTWGSSASLSVKATSNSTSAQLAQVSLPEPAVCSLYFQASVVQNTVPANATVGTLTLNLTQGVGRVAVPRQISFSGQPQLDAPLEFTIPFLPLHALQVDVSLSVLFTGETDVQVQCYLVLSPLTRIPQKQQKLAFGMALPGEADDLDDELRQDLESEGPSATQAVLEGRTPFDTSDGAIEVEGEDGEEGEDQPPQVPAWLTNVVDQLTHRYGRTPTRAELKQAVVRLQARRKRLRARGR